MNRLVFSRLSLLPLCLALLLASPVSSPAQTTSADSAQPSHPLLVGYFPQWGLYDQPLYLAKDLITPHGTLLLDQINYAQGFVTDGHCSVADPNADLHYAFTAQQSVDGVADTPDQPLRGYLNQLLKLKRRFPQVKILLSLEGRAASFADDAQPEKRQAFVASCINTFLKGRLAPGVDVPGLIDGFDIDWEFPRAEDADNYLALLTEFRRQMDQFRPRLLLSVAVGHSPGMSGAIGGDLAPTSALVDEVGLMTYDYTGPWSQRTGFLAPFSSPADHPYGSVQRSVEAYLAAGVPASKLIVGVPFYGYGWRLVPEENGGLFQEGEPIRGDRPYHFIEGLIANSTVFRDADSQEPWLFDGDAFWTYEDPLSVQRKAEYALELHLGGLMIWELSGDTPTSTLLRAAYQSLHSPEPPPSSLHRATRLDP